ncbi:hypothetical protein ACXYTP_11200 [Tsukamurella ocularis]|uniref:hypothetical protein n=1 Tax=Tsukamurella ocularis TaxID=1970234 RepID=UPI0039EF683D
MAEQTVDQMLDGGASCLQYFREMLDLAKRISSKQWPDWRDHVCRNYDNERGIDLASLRGDAVMLRQQATAARQAVTDQATAKATVRTAWPDNAGAQAVATLDAHHTRSEPVATTLERTATAAEAVPDAVVAAVATKVSDLSEFDKEAFGLGDVGYWNAAKIVGGLVVAVANPAGTITSANATEETVQRFEAQLAKDLARFDQVVAAAVSAVQAAYAAVPAAAKGIDASAFPAPSFGTITATTTQTPTSPTTASPVTSGGGGGGGTGSPTTSSPSSTSPSSMSPSSASPTSSSPTSATPSSASPSSTSPTSTGSTTPATTNGASTTPSIATPSTGTGTGAGSGTPSWLSQLLPKIAEQLRLGDKSGDKNGEKSADRSADKTGDKDEKGAADAKNGKGEKVLGVDALGRTVTATLSPDGKTVEVTAKKPDGTTEKVTLTVGEDGKLAVDGKDGVGKDGVGKDGAGAGGKGQDGTGGAGDAKPVEVKPTTQNDTGIAPVPASPSGATPSSGDGTAPSTGGGATPSVAPSTVAPVVPTAPAAPAKPSTTGAQDPAPAGEPCPPGESADQGTGAEFAVSGS